MFNHCKLAAKIAAGDFTIVLNGETCRAVPNTDGTGTLGAISWKMNEIGRAHV